MEIKRILGLFDISDSKEESDLFEMRPPEWLDDTHASGVSEPKDKEYKQEDDGDGLTEEVEE